MKIFKKKEYEKLMKKYKEEYDCYETRRLIQLIYAIANSENFTKFNQMMRIKNNQYKDSRMSTIMCIKDKLHFTFVHHYEKAGTEDFKFESNEFTFTQCIDYIYKTMSGTESFNYFMIGLI